MESLFLHFSSLITFIQKDATDNKGIQKLPETVNEPENELCDCKGFYSIIINVM